MIQQDQQKGQQHILKTMGEMLSKHLDDRDKSVLNQTLGLEAGEYELAKPVIIPEDKNTGLLSLHQIRQISQQCGIPPKMCYFSDTDEQDSVSYIDGFWKLSYEDLYNKLMQFGCLYPQEFDPFVAQEQSFNLRMLPVITGKVTFKPTLHRDLPVAGLASPFAHVAITPERRAKLLQWNAAIGSNPVTANLDDESIYDESEINSLTDDQVKTWIPKLIMNHSSVKYSPRYLEQCVVRDDDEEIHWERAIEHFIEMACRYRLSKAQKSTEFRSMIRTWAPEMMAAVSGASLDQMYERMIRYQNRFTEKERCAKRLLKYTRFPGQALRDCMETILHLYNRAICPGQQLSLDPDSEQYSQPITDYMLGCLMSLTEKSIAESIAKMIGNLTQTGDKHPVMYWAKMASRAEKPKDFPSYAIKLYDHTDLANVASTRVTIRSFIKQKGLSVNFMGAVQNEVNAEDPAKYAKSVQMNSITYPFSRKHDSDELTELLEERERDYKRLQKRLAEQNKEQEAIWQKLKKTVVEETTNDSFDDSSSPPPPPSPDQAPSSNNFTPEQKQKQLDELKRLSENAVYDRIASNTRAKQANAGSKVTNAPAKKNNAKTSTPAKGVVPISFENNDVDELSTIHERSTQEVEVTGKHNNTVVKLDSISHRRSIEEIKDPWQRSMKVVNIMETVDPKAFKFKKEFTNNMTDSQIEAKTKEFDLTPEFFQLGKDIFLLLGFPTAPANMSLTGVKKMLMRLDELKNVPLFYKKMFFNCPSLEPIYRDIAPMVNELCRIYKTQWLEDDLPVNTVSTYFLNNLNPTGSTARSTSRGRVEQGKYIPNNNNGAEKSNADNRKSRYDSNSVDNRNIRGNSRSFSRSRQGERSFSNSSSRQPNRGFNNQGGSYQYRTRSTSNKDRGIMNHNVNTIPFKPDQFKNNPVRLVVKFPDYQNLRCTPYICEGGCEKKICRKCSGKHSSHNCGYYLHLSPVPCERCPELFHNSSECQNVSVVFPEQAKN